MSTDATKTPMTAEQILDLWLLVPKRPFSARARRDLAEAESSTLPFGDVELPVSAWGQAGNPLVLLVHGWGGHRAQLSAFAQALAAVGYRTVSFDAPAHGDAPGRHTSGFEIAKAIQALTDVIGQPSAIVAHSLGTLASVVAVSRGVHTEKLVLSGPMRRLMDAMDPFLKMNNLPDSVREQVNQATRQRFGEDVWEVTALDKQLPKVGLPTLLIHDRDDEVTPYASSLALKRAYPDAELFTTRGLGHRRILRDPAVVQKVVDYITAA